MSNLYVTVQQLQKDRLEQKKYLESQTEGTDRLE
jgi:hypothetical protein